MIDTTKDWPMIRHLYSSRATFARLLNHFGLAGPGAEVGVWIAENAEHIMSEWAGKDIYLIDAWEYGDTLEQAMARMERFGDKVHFVKKSSVVAAQDFADESFDWVYIDACHEWHAISGDTEAWWPKVKRGGILAGHDYHDGLWDVIWDGPPFGTQIPRENCLDRSKTGVKTAVKCLAASRNRFVFETSTDHPPGWLIVK